MSHSFSALPAPCRNADRGSYTHLFLTASNKHALQGCPTSALAPSCRALHPATCFARRAALHRVQLPPLHLSTQNTAKCCRTKPWNSSASSHISLELKLHLTPADHQQSSHTWGWGNTEAAQLGTSPPTPAHLEAAMSAEQQAGPQTPTNSPFFPPNQTN